MHIGKSLTLSYSQAPFIRLKNALFSPRELSISRKLTKIGLRGDGSQSLSAGPEFHLLPPLRGQSLAGRRDAGASGSGFLAVGVVPVLPISRRSSGARGSLEQEALAHVQGLLLLLEVVVVTRATLVVVVVVRRLVGASWGHEATPGRVHRAEQPGVFAAGVAARLQGQPVLAPSGGASLDHRNLVQL